MGVWGVNGAGDPPKIRDPMGVWGRDEEIGEPP